ncbi:MAG: FAD/NAD(P)-binding protein [Acidobacteriia bacterium]|nr:FAD/NAD(P)-binding protein [Terriglobia bacterium]
MATESEGLKLRNAPGTDPMRPALFEVHRVRQETRDTFTLELRSRGPSDGFQFLPGQFNMVYVFGVGEVPISISGDPNRPNALFHTTRAVGAVTKAMRRLRRGDVLGIRGPFGASWPVNEVSAREVIIVAGGIGLAPLRPMIYQLLSQRDQRGRVVLLYGARTPDEILFTHELQQWRTQLGLEAFVTVDRAHGDWQGNVGVVTTLIPKAPFDPSQAVALVCGPEVMMRFTVMELSKRGISKNRIYISMERNMKCGIGLCGHCQFGPYYVCKDGPVFRYDQVQDLIPLREI